MDADHRRRRSLLAIAFLSPLITACAAGMATQVEEAVTPARPLPVRDLAVMPVTTEAGSEAIRPGLALDLCRSLQDRFPDLLIVEPDEARERLARSSAATEYADLLEDYERTGVVQGDRLARVADALGVDHFLQVRAAYLRESFLDTYLFDDELVTEDRQVLAVVARLWSGGGSMPEWEAVIRTRSETDDFDIRSRRIDELVGEVTRALADRAPLPHGSSLPPVGPHQGEPSAARPVGPVR